MITFNSKETYLAYRREWSQRFTDQLKRVRTAKQGIRTANREFSKGPRTRISQIWDAYASLRDARRETLDLQTELDEARVEAARQMSST